MNSPKTRKLAGPAEATPITEEELGNFDTDPRDPDWEKSTGESAVTGQEERFSEGRFGSQPTWVIFASAALRS
ncbi:hypothetical protein FD724_06830 [Nostoc sp. C057]|uniref:hypothetical protein n=1 Tax=Nostoc sp. C057 TaxID=2576903 RepID=UPI0015C382DD|nr:hypothetical protein [Nostoc sp. C057]QLE47853.1 hypothetical protein FD724_06830 [Nostoc sp. C057]